MTFAFKAVVTAVIIMTAAMLALAVTQIEKGTSRGIVLYAFGIYLLSAVAIWI